MDLKKIVISGIAGGIAILVVMLIIDYLIAQVLLPYDIMSLGGMRAQTDPLMMLFFLSPFVYSFAMSIAYDKLRDSFKGDFKSNGIKFGLLVWLLVAIPGSFVVYTSMTYPIGFTVSQIIGGLLWLLAGGIVIAKLME